MTKTGSENEASKAFSCFVCSQQLSDKGLPLMVSETTYSQICLGKKLQEILGDKLFILLNHKDSVCWKCATYINKFDKFEFELDLIREYILSSVLDKYNFKYEDLKDVISDSKPEGLLGGDLSSIGLEDEPRSKQSSLKSTKASKSEKPLKVRFSSSVKVKSEDSGRASDEGGYQSSGKEEYQCHICLHSFPNHDIFEKHVKLHNLAKSRFYKCKLCEFSSSNLEMYCRHICSLNTNKYVSCTRCKRSFLASQTQNEEGGIICKQCLDKKEIKTVASSRGPLLIGSDVTITRKLPTSKSVLQDDNTSSVHNYKILQSKEGSVSKLSQPPKPKFIRKLTTEGSIEYEEQCDNGESFSTQDVTITHRPPNLNSVDGETYSSDDNTADMNFDQTKSNDNVVYLYDEKNPEMKMEKATIKVEAPDNDNVSEIVVPDHLLEQISSKTGRTTPYMLKCSNCEEVLDVRQLPTHRCFLELEAVEFFEVENALEIDMGMTKKEPVDDCHYGYIDQDGYYQKDEQIVGMSENEEGDENYQPRLLCKTCFQQFPSITQLREHWQDSGHAWEVGTVNVDVKTIKDKVKDNEQTFKVVKQMFSMKANLPTQNNVIESDYTDEHMFNIKNLFVKVRANNECETCGKLFPTEEKMKYHMNEECLNCTYCNIKFLSNNLLKKHYMCTGHWRKIIRDQDPSTRPPLLENPVCHLCGKECFSRYSLCIHLKSHYKGTPKGFCHYCFKEFDDKNQVFDHVIESHNALLYKCQHCSQPFLTETKRDKHEVIKHKEVECRLCSLKFKSLKMLLNHNDQFHREKACKVCGKHIGSWQSLKRHEKQHFYEKGLHCGLCKKTFRNKTALKVHNASHHRGDFKYYCSICDSGFMTADACAEHKIVHLKSKNVCPKCGKKCRSRTAFWMHKKIHNGPYTCNVCNRVFRDTSVLAIHRRKHLRARPYQCPHCPRMFSVPKTLNRHLSVHVVSYPFRCKLCRRGFVSKKSYFKHLATSHRLKPAETKAPLPLNPSDEDIILAADTLISDDAVILNGYQREEESTITEVVVETTELFDEILS